MASRPSSHIRDTAGPESITTSIGCKSCGKAKGKAEKVDRSIRRATCLTCSKAVIVKNGKTLISLTCSACGCDIRKLTIGEESRCPDGLWI
jgi:hypothetical protein